MVAFHIFLHWKHKNTLPTIIFKSQLFKNIARNVHETHKYNFERKNRWETYTVYL